MIQLPMNFDSQTVYDLLSNVIGQGFVKITKQYSHTFEIEATNGKPKLYTRCKNGVPTDLIVCMVYQGVITDYCLLDTWNNGLGEQLVTIKQKQQKIDQRFDRYEPIQSISLYIA